MDYGPPRLASISLFARQRLPSHGSLKEENFLMPAAWPVRFDRNPQCADLACQVASDGL